MTAVLVQSEAGAKGARRILRRQLEKALESLAVRRLTDERVHDARKRIKKARAATRLLRDALGKGAYTRENAALRDVARPLSQVRDSRVLLDTLEFLARVWPDVPLSTDPGPRRSRGCSDLRSDRCR